MSNAWIVLLVVYFSLLMAGSLITAVVMWKPTNQPLVTNTTKVIETPSLSSSTPTPASAINTSKTITNNVSGTTIRNITDTIVGKNLKKETINISFIPSSLERETRLVILSLLFGIIGSSVHGVTSLTIWHSRNKLDRTFFSWYVTRPLVGAALAVTVYLLLRSTLLTTVAPGSQSAGGITFINDYGVAGISALVGLMTAQMTQKLRDVFDAMFGIQKGTDKGEIQESQENNITLIPKEILVGLNQSSVLVATVKDNATKPLPSINVHFGIVDSNVVKPLGNSTTTVKTDSNGMALLQIHANKEGITKVHAAIEIENKTIYDSSTVKVIGAQQVTA
jgi:hypothetical protein